MPAIAGRFAAPHIALRVVGFKDTHTMIESVGDVLHAVGVSEIVFGSRSIDSRLYVAVDVYHVVALAPPTPRLIMYRDVATDVVSAPCGLQKDVVAYAVKVGRTVYRLAMIGRERVFPTIRQTLAAEVGVKVEQVFVQFAGVVLLIIHIKVDDSIPSPSFRTSIRARF